MLPCKTYFTVTPYKYQNKGLCRTNRSETTEIHNNDSFLVSVIQYIINFPVSRRCVTMPVPQEQKSKYSQSSREECIFQILVLHLFAKCLNAEIQMHLYSNLELDPTIHPIKFSCEITFSFCYSLLALLGVRSASGRGVITKPHWPGTSGQ